MRKFSFVFGILILSAFVLAACSATQAANEVMDGDTVNMAENASDAMETGNEMANDSEEDMAEDSHGEMDNTGDDTMENSSDEMMEDETGEEADQSKESNVTTPSWFNYQFTEATTGEPIIINSYRGKVVLVETMATWCSNCLQQQKQVRELRDMLGERDDFVTIAIGLDTELDLGFLSNYAQDNGFDWLYVVAPRDVQTAIHDSFGGQFLNPPATPIFIIDKDGNTHELPLGRVKPAGELLEAVEAFLN